MNLYNHLGVSIIPVIAQPYELEMLNLEVKNLPNA